MKIKKAQELVWEHLNRIGYTKSETSPLHAFLHLSEEVGEVARTLLHKETKRGKFVHSKAGDMEEELAVRLNYEFSYPIYRDLFFQLHFKYKVIYICKKIELNFLSTGISYSFDMPKWLKEFLR